MKRGNLAPLSKVPQANYGTFGQKSNCRILGTLNDTATDNAREKLRDRDQNVRFGDPHGAQFCG
jgi:hypothetical protein